MRAVVDDPDHRPLVLDVRPPHPVRRKRPRRLELVTGQEQRVAQEAGQVAQVLGTALPEVGQGLRHGTRGHGRQRHQLGIRGGLTADHHGRLAGRRSRRRALPPRRAARRAGGPRQPRRHRASGARPSRSSRAGFATFQPASASAAASRSVSAVESSSRFAGTRDRSFLGVSTPRPEVRRRQFLTPPRPEGFTVAGPSRNHTGFLHQPSLDAATLSDRPLGTAH